MFPTALTDKVKRNVFTGREVNEVNEVNEVKHRRISLGNFAARESVYLEADTSLTAGGTALEYGQQTSRSW